MPAQRQAKILGTSCMRSFPYFINILHYASLLGIGSGQRQLIAVTCLAEHA